MKIPQGITIPTHIFFSICPSVLNSSCIPLYGKILIEGVTSSRHKCSLTRFTTRDSSMKRLEGNREVCLNNSIHHRHYIIYHVLYIPKVFEKRLDHH